MLTRDIERLRSSEMEESPSVTHAGDAYFSADIETDGPIPGPYSMLSFAIVYAGSFDGRNFIRPTDYRNVFYRELRPISDAYEEEALRVNGLDRQRLLQEGALPSSAMDEASSWIGRVAGAAKPVLVAYPVSFDWSWLYWYFVRFSSKGSPFGHSRCFDIKTAVAVKSGLPVSRSGRSRLSEGLRADRPHTHHAVDDAVEQAEIFANVFEWKNFNGGID